jgi:hypothetical protein
MDNEINENDAGTKSSEAKDFSVFFLRNKLTAGALVVFAVDLVLSIGADSIKQFFSFGIIAVLAAVIFLIGVFRGGLDFVSVKENRKTEYALSYFVPIFIICGVVIYKCYEWKIVKDGSYSTKIGSLRTLLKGKNEEIANLNIRLKEKPKVVIKEKKENLEKQVVNNFYYNSVPISSTEFDKLKNNKTEGVSVWSLSNDATIMYAMGDNPPTIYVTFPSIEVHNSTGGTRFLSFGYEFDPAIFKVLNWKFYSIQFGPKTPDVTAVEGKPKIVNEDSQIYEAKLLYKTGKQETVEFYDSLKQLPTSFNLKINIQTDMGETAQTTILVNLREATISEFKKRDDLMKLLGLKE